MTHQKAEGRLATQLFVQVVREIAGAIASAWIGFMLTAILHVQMPLKDPGAVWFLTAAAVWAYGSRMRGEEGR